MEVDSLAGRRSALLATLRAVGRFLLPSPCLLCGGRGVATGSPLPAGLCFPCLDTLPRNEHHCVRCALPVAASASAVLCGRCQRQTPSFDMAFSPFLYRDALPSMIYRMKVTGNLALAATLGELLYRHLPETADRPQCLIAIPLHPSRQRRRGFNQSQELCRVLARGWRIPLLRDVLIRCRDNPPQKGLDARQRKRNCRGIFRLTGAIRYRHVALVDDVMTTGATLNEAARVLKQAGVGRVDVYALARA